MIVEDLGSILTALGIEAKQVGQQLVACCPNPGHPDSKPSWAIHLHTPKHPHGCWSCGYKGTIFDLVVDRLGFTGGWRYGEAEEWLRGRSRSIAAREVTFRFASSEVDACTIPAGVEFGALRTWMTPARDYAIRRGITGAQVESWRLGYAAVGRLSGRLVVPVYAASGALLTYSARTFVGDDARYLSGDERADGAKEDAVFGEDRWSHDLPIVICEGAINALAVERACPDVHVAALLGSKPRALHAWKMKDFARVLVMTDADKAGEHAAFALTVLSRAVRVALPDKRDAAETHPDVIRAVVHEGLAKV